MVTKRIPPAGPMVTFWGAAGTVTGSMHRLDAGGQTLLLDCGLFQGSRATSHRRNRAFPFRPKDVDAVLLSHAHIDHCGNLPNLGKQGFAGPIYCTTATRALAGIWHFRVPELGLLSIFRRQQNAPTLGMVRHASGSACSASEC